MCGITGIIKFNSKAVVDKKAIQKATETIKHRGPDGEGVFVDEGIGLGHRRLSIIDLSNHGHQPMFYDKKNLVIVFNGEIYNYLELKKELLSKGYKFQSNSDTEVILASYLEWGKDCLKKFNGMWAFVIYDRKKKLVFGARDRLGVKPFYYYYDSKQFVFGSEIKAILAFEGITPKPNQKTIWNYLVCGMVDHNQDTFFKDILQLPAGHYFEIKGKKLKIQEYWQIEKQILKEGDYAKTFKDLFTDSVKLRLRSDVPIGTCLSGGLDSSAIACVVNDFLKKEKKLTQVGLWQKTFSAVYDQEFSDCDEQKFIKEVIKKTHAKSYLVFPSGKDLLREIRDLTWFQDSPFNSTSIFAQWNVFRLAAKKGIKVMLDGQGADEQLGYPEFFGIYLIELFRKFKIFKIITEMIGYKKYHKISLLLLLRDLFKGLVNRGLFGRYLADRFRKNQIEYSIFDKNFLNKYHESKMLSPKKNLFYNSLYSATKMSLSSLLRYEDRNSMAFSIESRVPFLDYRLVEFIFSLPDSQKINFGRTKWIMRQALKGILPEKIRNRHEKIGFATPEENWIKKVFYQEMENVFTSEKFLSRGFYQREKVLQIFRAFLNGRNDNYRIFWRLYNLEIWYRVFIDKETVK